MRYYENLIQTKGCYKWDTYYYWVKLSRKTLWSSMVRGRMDLEGPKPNGWQEVRNWKIKMSQAEQWKCKFKTRYQARSALSSEFKLTSSSAETYSKHLSAWVEDRGKNSQSKTAILASSSCTDWWSPSPALRRWRDLRTSVELTGDHTHAKTTASPRKRLQRNWKAVFIRSITSVSVPFCLFLANSIHHYHKPIMGEMIRF